MRSGQRASARRWRAGLRSLRSGWTSRRLIGQQRYRQSLQASRLFTTICGWGWEAKMSDEPDEKKQPASFWKTVQTYWRKIIWFRGILAACALVGLADTLGFSRGWL